MTTTGRRRRHVGGSRRPRSTTTSRGAPVPAPRGLRRPGARGDRLAVRASRRRPSRGSGPSRPRALDWFEPWHTVLEWDLPFAKWFVGGTLNVSHNCLDRHVAAGLGDRVAYHWEGEPGDTRTITYAELLAEVERFANVLKGLGVRRGDRVAIYMPMIPELPVAMLACTRDRRRPLGRVRRVLARRPARPDQRRRGQGARHRRRRLAPGAARGAQGRTPTTAAGRQRPRSSTWSWPGAPGDAGRRPR